jgi:hypothetical protein
MVRDLEWLKRHGYAEQYRNLEEIVLKPAATAIHATRLAFEKGVFSGKAIE